MLSKGIFRPEITSVGLPSAKFGELLHMEDFQNGGFDLTLNFDLDLWAVSSDIWRICRTSKLNRTCTSDAKLTNEPTNKHDGLQYLLAEVIIITQQHGMIRPKSERSYND